MSEILLIISEYLNSSIFNSKKIKNDFMENMETNLISQSKIFEEIKVIGVLTNGRDCFYLSRHTK